MQLTPSARARLQRLLDAAGREAHGFQLREIFGTCSGSTPLLKPAPGPGKREVELEADGICFYVPARYLPLLETASLDYDRSLFGKGLTVTWPHREGCACAALLAATDLCGASTREKRSEHT